jgi:hypothetical protein
MEEAHPGASEDAAISHLKEDFRAKEFLLLVGGAGLVSVVLGVGFSCFGRVMGGVMQMPLGGVSVVRGRFVIAFLMVPGGLAMMASRVLVVFSCIVMMFCRLFGHSVLPAIAFWIARRQTNRRLLMLCEPGVNTLNPC